MTSEHPGTLSKLGLQSATNFNASMACQKNDPTSAMLCVFDLLDTGVLLLDNSGRIRKYNDKATSILGKVTIGQLFRRAEFTRNWVRCHASDAKSSCNSGRASCSKGFNELELSFSTVSLEKICSGYLVLVQIIEQRLSSIYTDLAMVYSLTPVEVSVLELLSEGFTNKRIASIRDVSEQTVKTQVKSVLEKTQCSTRGQLSRIVLSRAVQWGFTSAP